MYYPPFSDYNRAVKQAADHFNVLSHLRPVLNLLGEPVCCKGRRSVVFEMHDEQNGKDVAVKCFLKGQKGRAESYRLIAEELSGVQSDYFVPVRYLEQELTVTSEEGEEETYPVVVMDWVQGVELHHYVKLHLFEKYPLQMLAYRFSCLASWLMDQPFAHADLRPENILVRPDGSLVLVDYDAMYVPAMKGQEPREQGCDDYYFFFVNSRRFNERIDDFALVTLLLSLKAVSLRLLLWKEFVLDTRIPFSDSDVLLFSDVDYNYFGRSPLFEKLQDLFSDTELARLCGLFFMAHADGNLAKASSECLKLELPRQMAVEEMTAVTDDDRYIPITDYGVDYSLDGLRLLQAPEELTEYTVREGTRVICNNAFKNCKFLKSVTFPDSLTVIGDCAFDGCISLTHMDLPSGLTSIGDSAFEDCHSLQSVTLPAGLKSIGDVAFRGCRLLQSLDLPSGLTSIGDVAFSGCRSLQSLDFPAGLKSIGIFAFSGCCSLQSLDLPAGLKSIGFFAFSGCCSLQSVTLPAGLTSIGDAAFSDCHSLQSVTLPAGLTSIGSSVFHNCPSLRYLLISAKALSHFKEILPSEYHSLLKVQSKPQSLRNDVDADDALEAQT